MSKKIPTETIIRAIVLFVTLVNTILTMSGKNPFFFMLCPPISAWGQGADTKNR